LSKFDNSQKSRSLGFALYGKYLLFKKKVPRKPFPDDLAPNKDLGLPELLTIANAPFKFASMLS
jgi:hypothetical protein